VAERVRANILVKSKIVRLICDFINK